MSNLNLFPFSPKSFPLYYGWILIIFTTLGVISSIPGQTAGFSPFTDELIKATGMPRSLLSLAYLMGTVTSGLLLPKMGRVLDNMGPRLFTFITCGCFSLAMLFLSYIEIISRFLRQHLSLSSESIFFVLLIIGLFSLRFFGQGLLPLISSTLIGKWFDKWRGTAVAFTGVINSIAFSTAPTLMYALVSSMTWQGAWRSCALVIGPLMGLAGLIFYRSDPEACGLEVDGSSRHQQVKVKKITGKTLTEARKSLPFWTVNLVLATHAMVFTAVAFHITALGADYHIAKEKALAIFIFITVVAIPLGFIASNLSRFIRMKYIIIVMTLGQVLAFVTFPLIGHRLGYSLSIMGLGMAGGMFGTLYSLSLPWYFGRKHLGAIQGTLISTLVIASALGPYFFSIVKDLIQSFTPAFYLSLVFPITTFFMALGIDPQARYREPT